MNADSEAWETDLMAMASEELIFTLAYIILTVCFIHPPTEFVSAGLTVQNLLANFLGSEDMNFDLSSHQKNNCHRHCTFLATIR